MEQYNNIEKKHLFTYRGGSKDEFNGLRVSFRMKLKKNR